MRTLLWTGLLLLFVFKVPCGAEEQTQENRRIFGLVIGFNGTDDPEMKPLHYADDDAMQNASLLAEQGDLGGVILLTRLDADTQRLYPDAKPTPPTRQAVATAIERLNSLMDQARQKGEKPVLYFFYSGHGDVENNRGFVHLEGERFYRQDLLRLLAESRAETNHVIIDACKSYFLIFDRGVGGKRQPVSGQLLDKDSPLPRNTGVFLSTSSAADSHEWEAFQGGVFNHELRSALRGGADTDRNLAVSYQEAAAFIWTANLAIVNRRFRPSFFIHPPKDSGPRHASVLMRLNSPAATRLQIDLATSRHLYVEDEHGRRLADLHPAEQEQVCLLLPRQRALFVRFPGENEEAQLPDEKQCRLSDLSLRRTTASRRGAEHAAFRSLFSKPFDGDALRAYENRPDETISAGPVRFDWTWIRRGMGISAIVLGLGGGTLTGLALYERNQVDDDTNGLARSEVNERLDKLNTGAVVCYALAGTALASYLIWTLWPDEELELQLMPGPEPQMQLMLRF